MITHFPKTVEIDITLTIRDHADAGSADKQFVTVIGETATTAEMECKADFNKINTDVSCNLIASIDDLGPFKCVKWRSAGTDNLDFTKVSCNNYEVEIIDLILKS